jgi:hypothetical protein
MFKLVFDHSSAELRRKINQNGGRKTSNKLSNGESVVLWAFGPAQGTNIKKLMWPIELTFDFFARRTVLAR